MYIDPNLASQYGLNFQNPTVQMMCGAQSPHTFSSVGGQFVPNSGYYGYPQQPAIACYSYGNPTAGYYQQPTYQQQVPVVDSNPYLQQQAHDQFINRSMAEIINNAHYGNYQQQPTYAQPNQGSFSAYCSGPSNNPYINYQYSTAANPYTCSNPYYADTSQMDIHQQETYEYEKLKQMYVEGKITPAQYAGFANAGIEHTTAAGTHVYAQPQQPQYSGWGGVTFGFNTQEYIQRQKAAQEAAEQNRLAFELCCKINNNYFGITEQEAEETHSKRVAYEQSLNERKRQEAEIEYTYDMFAEQFKGAVYSDQKGYMSPAKEQAYKQFNSVWDDRHKNFNEHYTLTDLMKKGVYADIVFGDMQYAMDRHRHNLVRMYDEIFVKNSISTLAPFYNPNGGGFSYKGFKINKNELEISVPPELIKQDYQNRRETFFNTVYNNRTDNLPADEEYLRKRYSNPAPVKIDQKLQL